MRPVLVGVKFRVAAAQVALAEESKSGALGEALCNKSESFEDRSIAETRRIVDELFIVSIVASKIADQAVLHMLNAATDGGIIEHVDGRAMDVGYRHPRLMAPDALRAKHLPLVDVL